MHFIGFGWLTVNVFGATFVKSYLKCDPWNFCDLYVKVLVDNKELCRTDFQLNKMSADFFKTCISNKIQKTATIIFELWDKDVKVDDLMDRWELSIYQAIESYNFKVYSSYIQMNAFWKDEYLENWE